MQQPTRRLPLITTGVLLVLISVAPTIVGMLRGFHQLHSGQPAIAVDADVHLAFHPAFVLCGVVGMVILIVGIFVRVSAASR